MIQPFRLIPIIAIAAMLPVTQASAGNKETIDRFKHYSLEPFVEFQPGFTRDVNQVFTLELAGIGHEPITVEEVVLNDRPLPGESWSVELGTLVVRPGAEFLKQGGNTFEMRYQHPKNSRHDGSQLQFRSTVNHQPDSPVITLGDRGEMLVNGEPKFILASFRSGQTDDFTEALPSAREAGFDMVHDYGPENTDTSKVGVERYIEMAREYLRAAHAEGLSVFLGLPRNDVNSYNEEHLIQIITELSNEPALHIWYLMDEPRTNSLPVLNAARVYQLLQRLDPDRLSMYCLNSIGTSLVYSAFCDLVWRNRYSVIATSSVLSSLAPMTAYLQHGNELQKTFGRPSWLIVQVHDFKGFPSLRERVPTLEPPSDRNHRPTADNVRAQSHLAIAAGTMGISYYWLPERWYSMKTDTPGFWREFTKVLHEIRDLEPVLLAEDQPAFGTEGGNEKIMVWSRSHNGSNYYGIVNTSLNTPGSLTLLPQGRVATTKQIQGNGRSSVGNGKVELDLPPSAVVVLRMDAGN